jgi:hypothetical protein
MLWIGNKPAHQRSMLALNYDGQVLALWLSMLCLVNSSLHSYSRVMRIQHGLGYAIPTLAHLP